METSVAAEIPVPAAAVAAPVPLTAIPAEGTAPEAVRVKRKYTKRAGKVAAPKAGRKPAKVKAAKVKAPKAEKKPKRVSGTKAQGQVAKGVLKFLKAAAKEKGVTTSALVGIGVTRYAKSLGFDPEA